MKVVRWAGNQPGQAAFLADCMPGWTLFQAGLGSGKTWAGARKFLVLHSVNDCTGAMIAPTYGDIWRVMVPEITRAAEEAGLALGCYPNGAGAMKVPHLTACGQTILLVSGDDPDRLVGWEAGHLWIDEGARLPVNRENPRRDAPTQVRGRLRHRHVRSLHGLITTTAEGRDTFIQADFFDKPKEGHRAYIGKTRLNPALDPSYSSGLLSAMGAELAAQYLDGEAVSYSADRAHPMFKREHSVGETRLLPYATRFIGADFNVAPLCWVLCQEDADGSLLVHDEVVIDNNGQVDAGVMDAHAKRWGHEADGSPATVEVCPDHSSARRSTVGDPEISVMAASMKAAGWTAKAEAFGANPPVDSRINLLSRCVMDATGRRRLRVNPRCVKLIDDMERTARTPRGYDPGPRGDRGHILDALGYVAWRLHEPAARATVGNWRL